MFESVVDVAAGVRAEVCSVRRTNMHMHPNAIEVLYVLRGTLRVMVSCENYELAAGDFSVLNRTDAHLLDGSEDNVTAVVHLDPLAFRDIDPHVNDLCFACESWDLARYLRQESLLRGILLDVVVDADRDAGRLRDHCDHLMRLLCTGYSLESYYHRDAHVTAAQRENFRAIFSAVRQNAHRRDVLDVVADAHHYSKSYVSHVVKDVAAISFSDVLVYLRLANAERLLLTTEATMLDIAAQCGFSDVKYFTRGFVDWFRQTPTEYRTAYRREVLLDSHIESVPTDVTMGLVDEHRRRVASPTGGPRLAITPLLLKNVGSRVDLFERLRTRAETPRMPAAPAVADAPRHLVPIGVAMSDVENGYLLDGLASFDQINARPVLVVHYAAKTSTSALLNAIAERLAAAAIPDVAIWLVYDGPHDRAGVDHVIDRATADHGLDVYAVLMT